VEKFPEEIGKKMGEKDLASAIEYVGRSDPSSLRYLFRGAYDIKLPQDD